jgi:hypothetical protein
MCCLAKCLLGVLFGWIIFFVNLAAAGALLAGAFAPWVQYSASPAALQGVQVNFFVAGLGVAGTSSSGAISIPSGTTIAAVSAALAAASKVSNSSVTWTEPASLNPVYLGMAAQVAAAASILAYTVLSSFLCLCTLCCCCCPQSHAFNALLAVAKLGVAMIGVVAMGIFFAALDTALQTVAASPAAITAVSSSSSVVLALALTAGAAGTPGVGPGKGLGSLGVALLGVNVVLHVLQMIKCGGALHHPEKPKGLQSAAGTR